MKITKQLLEGIDQWLYEFFMGYRDLMPSRFSKLLALYYPDARIRKQYAAAIGVEMGEDTFANLGLKVVPNDNAICVHIGARVSIAPNVTFLCSAQPNNGHEIKKIPYVMEQLVQLQDVVVEDEAWLGSDIVIFPGVTVGKCAVIGAGSVLMQNAEPYSVYAGVPARKIRDLKTGERV